MKVLYVTWDGPAQNYMESLFFPLFERMGELGVEVDVLQYLWGPEALRRSIADAAKRAGLGYEAREVWRRAPLSASTAAMIARGGVEVAQVATRRGADVVMPRTIIPAGMSLLARRRLGPDLRLAFDADGFMADERVDFGGWSPRGITYRLFRDIEAQMTRASQAVITRTEQGKQILTARAGAGFDPHRVCVAPNARPESEFSPGTPQTRAQTRASLDISPDAPLIVYAGSLGPHYFPEEMLRFFAAVRRRAPDARMVILTGQPDVALAAQKKAGVPTQAVLVQRVPPSEVPTYLAAADLGLAFRAPSFSQRGVCPIKVGEYLLCGTPVLSTRGVGDVDAYLDGVGLGRLLDDLGEETLEEAAAWFVDGFQGRREIQREAARARGVSLFGLDACARRWVTALEGEPS